MKTNLKIVKIDVTHHWNEDFLRELNTGKVYDYYLYDANQTTNCCELTPSYYLFCVYTETENTLSETKYDEFEYNDSHENIYMHCADADKLKTEDQTELNFEYDNDEDYFESISDVEEYFLDNPSYFEN